MDEFRRFFLRGLAAVAPMLVTVALIVWSYNLVNDYFGTHITRVMLWTCARLMDDPSPGLIDYEDSLKYGTPIDEWDERGHRLTVESKILKYAELSQATEEERQAATARRNLVLWQIVAAKYKLHLLGFLIAIILVYFMGYFLASFIGRASWRAAERLLARVPLVRAVYPNVKQVTDFLLTERNVQFSRVVAAQYPRKGIWSVGLLTGPPMTQIQDKVGQELVTVFIPSSPTPITGYVIQLPKEDIIELGDVSIDEALRFTISAGVIRPGAALPGFPASEEKV